MPNNRKTTSGQQALFTPPPSKSREATSSTFVDNMRLPIHGWFRYSAGFSAEWVQFEIKKRSAESGHLCVFDPFAGSGTTLIASQQAGAEAMGTDSHKFMARIAKAKMCWTADPNLLANRADKIARTAVPDPDPNPPDLLAKCFQPDTLATLRGLRRSLDECASGDDIDQLLWLALVAILRPCSHVGTAQWQYVLPNKSKARVADPLDAFRLLTDAMRRDMEQVQSETPDPPTATYVETDARRCEGIPDGWADLVLTSPPYANNYDYADATRLEMTFLGEVSSWGDLKRVRQALIRSCSQAMTGFDAEAALADPLLDPIRDELIPVFKNLEKERKNHGGKKAYHHMIIAYFLDLAGVWAALRRVTAPGGEVCFVVGDSAPYGVYVPVERWLGEIAENSGFKGWKFEKLRDRNLKWKNRKHQVPLHEGRLWVMG